MRPCTGHTLLELAIALTLIGMTAAAAAGPLGRARDHVAVAAARRDLATAVAMTRAIAIARGGARLVVDPAASRVWVETEEGAHAGSEVAVGARYGVTLHTARAARIELRFDALGIGRMANATVRVRRGDAETELAVSAYGRVRQ